MAPEAARRLASVLGRDQAIEFGQVLPPLWHWAYFPERAGTCALGLDGHPRRLDVWAVSHPRRVAGGGQVTRFGGLVVGREAQRRSELAEVKERNGRSGPSVICNWQHTYTQEGQTVLEETQTVIYRSTSTQSRRRSAEIPHGELVRCLRFNPVLLFRFSAATWNAHRIHYDRQYATEVEGYPGVVVHGPLLAILLAQEAEAAIGQPGELAFRYESPVFDDDTVDVYVHLSDENSCQVEARTGSGALATYLSARR